MSDAHLSEGDLPGPLCVAGHVAAHDPALPHELAAADLAVVGVGVEGVEGAGAALGGAHVVVVQRHVDLGRVLADVVSKEKAFKYFFRDETEYKNILEQQEIFFYNL